MKQRLFQFSKDFEVEYKREFRHDTWEFPTGEGYEYEDVIVVEDGFAFIWESITFTDGEPRPTPFLYAVRETVMFEEKFEEFNSNFDEGVALQQPTWRFLVPTKSAPWAYVQPSFFPTIGDRDIGEKIWDAREWGPFLPVLQEFFKMFLWRDLLSPESTPYTSNPKVISRLRSVIAELKTIIRKGIQVVDRVSLNNPRGF